MRSLNSDIFWFGMSFASTRLSALMQLSKQCLLMKQRGYILHFPFQVTRPLTFLLAKEPPHVSLLRSLKASGGNLFVILLLFFFLFLSSTSSALLSILGVGVVSISLIGGAVNTDGRVSLTAPMRTGVR